MKRLLLCGLAAVCLFAQGNRALEVAVTEGPPPVGWTNLYFYTTINAKDFVQYICYADTRRSIDTIAVTEIVDAANTATITTAVAHGLAVGNRVTLSGATGDTDLNGTHLVLSVPSTTTFTVTSASVTDDTYNEAGMAITTTAPRTTQPYWAIEKYSYGGSTGEAVTMKQWAAAAVAEKSGPSTIHVCDDRAALAYQ